ncbi:MAG: nitrile hydratase [marine actinobacterium MedAcidi-G3]|nr:MAG: nitrile hydratase [marine actinobacterium MedAcidi-G3]MAR54488.1 nitrile hydratase subunit alpha [Acidimicrobiaceae bacterium]MBA4812568.1 nitrile hydratase subunit alpha [Acidimicrobiales bacterium]RPH17671.1 MAG: nitrile hydratase subunit alpha [Actinobacteria bacterium TMED270]MBD53299.1 nitrile hydratase subunit alpha [Acidimicrobiaceae bacterium]|tara:strand:+ start:1753 stop:2361 length:609 start_codon:yes stop_codon:yes gene_type:complete
MNKQDDHHHGVDPNSPEVRTEALEDLLVEKGLIDRGRVDALIERFEHDLGPMIGARLVAKSWLEPQFRKSLLENADRALEEENIKGAEIEHVEVKANEPGVHNVVVCTLCSCYPWALLGLPPSWYKSPEYRSRVVREPRKVLQEMGLSLDAETEIRVWDSSSETRFLVLPERPEGTEQLGLEELAQLVTRDSMIGVAKAKVS